jgi:hypothetical protein
MGPVRGTIAFLVVVACLLVGADRLGAWEAGNLISGHLARSYRLSPQPTASVGGIPFLTQWAQGRYQEIDVQVPRASLQGVTVTDVRVRARDVSTPAFITSSSQLTDATAGSLTASGVVPFSALGLPQGVTASADGGRLRLAGPIDVNGTNALLVVTVAVSAQDGRLVLTPQAVTLDGRALPAPLAAQAEQELTTTFSVSSLLDGLQLKAVAVQPSGIGITATGSNLRIPA